jgi:hypothetical protein
MRLFTPGQTVTLAVTTTSARVADPPGEQLCIQNLGTTVAYVAFNSSAVVATVTDFPIQPGAPYGVTVPGGSTHIAAICASGTTTLAITGGYGV